MWFVIVVAGIVVAAVFVRSTLLRVHRKHDPIEYYRGWGGYWHPIGLEHKITKDEADAIAARGAVYLVGYFDADGKPTAWISDRLHPRGLRGDRLCRVPVPRELSPIHCCSRP